jgi:hypothetical protein
MLLYSTGIRRSELACAAAGSKKTKGKKKAVKDYFEPFPDFVADWFHWSPPDYERNAGRSGFSYSRTMTGPAVCSWNDGWSSRETF